MSQDKATEHDTDQTDTAQTGATQFIPLTIGRTGTWTMLPDWVALSGISARAQALYWQLALHLNRRRGDRIVFPSRQNLANRLGFTQPRTIDRYLTELIQVGAIDKHTTRTSARRSRNFYVLHLEPRPGYPRPRSLADIPGAESEPHQPAQDAAKDAHTRTTNVRVRAPQRGAYTHSNQKNLNQKNHHLHRRANATEVAPDGGGRITREDPARHVVVEAEHLLRTLPRQVELSENAIRQAAPWAARALEAGWPGDRLRVELTRDLYGARNVPGVIIHRLQNLPPPPLPAVVTQNPAASAACSDHPGAARRSDGECAGCWADRQQHR